jgi:hypothetical protein
MLRRVDLVRTDVRRNFVPSTLLPKLGTSLRTLAIYKPTPLPATPTILCILNSEFHASFLSHLLFLRSVRRLLITASVVPSSLILVTLMKEALSSSETSVLTRATRRNIPENAILHVKINFLTRNWLQFQVEEAQFYTKWLTEYSSYCTQEEMVLQFCWKKVLSA